MSALSKLLVLFALALSVSSLTTPHVGRSVHNHHALAARKAAPEPAPVAAPVDAQVVNPKKLRRRSDGSRCRVKTSSAAASSTPAATSSSSSVSVAPSTTAVPAAVEAAPTTSSKVQTTEAKTTTEAAKETPTTTSTKETPTPEPTSSKVTTSKAASTTSSASSSSGSLPSFLVGTQTGQGMFRYITCLLVPVSQELQVHSMPLASVLVALQTAATTRLLRFPTCSSMFSRRSCFDYFHRIC